MGWLPLECSGGFTTGGQARPAAPRAPRIRRTLHGTDPHRRRKRNPDLPRLRGPRTRRGDGPVAHRGGNRRSEIPRLQPDGVGPARQDDSGRVAEGRAPARAGRRALEDPAHGVAHLRGPDPRGGGPAVDGRRGRRGGVLGDTAGFARPRPISPRGRPRARADHPPRAGWTAPSAARSGSTTRSARTSSAPFIPPPRSSPTPSSSTPLPRRELRAGLYEVVKYGVIADRPLFDRIADGLPQIFARKPELLVDIVAASCRIKAEVVAADEREGGRRRILNFGHTAGHALEAVTRYRRLRHGARRWRTACWWRPGSRPTAA